MTKKNTNRQKKRQLKRSIILAIYSIILFNSLIIYDAFTSALVVAGSIMIYTNILLTIILVIDKNK